MTGSTYAVSPRNAMDRKAMTTVATRIIRTTTTSIHSQWTLFWIHTIHQLVWCLLHNKCVQCPALVRCLCPITHSVRDENNELLLLCHVVNDCGQVRRKFRSLSDCQVNATVQGPTSTTTTPATMSNNNNNDDQDDDGRRSFNKGRKGLRKSLGLVWPFAPHGRHQQRSSAPPTAVIVEKLTSEDGSDDERTGLAIDTNMTS